MKVRFAVIAAAHIGCTASSDPCNAGDTDGVLGGDYTFDLGVDDATFTPIILKAQNRANVTLAITNHGQKQHDFVVDCIPTPNTNGCPPSSCFPTGATVGAITPGATVTVTFITPNPEGIYTFRSDLPGDTMTGQLVVQ